MKPTYLLKSPIFLFGLALKIFLSYFFTSYIIVNLYVPFLEFNIQEFNIHPWASWIANGGEFIAFPYGYVMYLIFAFPMAIASTFALHSAITYKFILILFDVIILVNILRLYPKKQNLILLLYWLNPIALIAPYILGYNDIIPTAFLLLALISVKRNNFTLSAILLAITISIKFSFMIVAPLFFIYFLNNPPYKRYFFKFINTFLICCCILWGPILALPESRLMLFMISDVQRLYSLKIMFDDQYAIYIVPLLYSFLLYSFWRIRRINKEMLSSLIPLTLLATVLLINAQPGWFLWSLPFLVLYQLESDKISVVLNLFLATIYTVVVSPNILLTSTPITDSFPQVIQMISSEKFLFLCLTVLTSVGSLICIRIWRQNIEGNDFFIFNRKRYSIGIAGDSGAGKDTLSDAILNIFGQHSAINISGDDYHIWDRRGYIWQAITHLNPMANHLNRMENDVFSLLKGKSIFSAHYDHEIGKFKTPQKRDPRDIVIASGLHVLYPPGLREIYDLKIYLDMDADLREFLKIRRDVYERGKTIEDTLTSMKRRERDSKRYIKPQLSNADLIFSVIPLRELPSITSTSPYEIQTKLQVRMKAGSCEHSLLRTLIGLYGFMINLQYVDNGQSVIIELDGDLSSKDAETLAMELYPELSEMFDLNPTWESGTLSLMTIFILSQMNFAFKKAG